jgi:RNA polymerase-binding transcription factor DksA
MDNKKYCKDCGKEINPDRFHAKNDKGEYLCALCWIDYRDKKGKYENEVGK